MVTTQSLNVQSSADQNAEVGSVLPSLRVKGGVIPTATPPLVMAGGSLPERLPPSDGRSQDSRHKAVSFEPITENKL
jgi:hypothetical protein